MVRAEFHLGGDWEKTDALITEAVGRRGDTSSVSYKRHPEKGGIREVIWWVAEFDQAVEMRKRLELVDGVNATIREK